MDKEGEEGEEEEEEEDKEEEEDPGGLAPWGGGPWAAFWRRSALACSGPRGPIREAEPP